MTRDSAQRRPSDKHRSDARNFLLIDRLSPRPTGLPPCSARSCPSIARSRRCGHSARCTNTAVVHSKSTEIFIEIAPHSALVSENAAQVSNEATVATVTSLQIARQGHQVAARQPVAIEEAYHPTTTTTAASAASWPRSCPAGPSVAGTPFRPWTTSSPPTAPCHPKGPQRQRRTREAG